jgi:hypothetical protein
MAQWRTWLASAAAFALLFGLGLPDLQLTGAHSPVPSAPATAADQGLDASKPGGMSARRNARTFPSLISRLLD